MDIHELFWNATPDELKQGYIQQGEQFICLLCGEAFEQGIIYPDGDRFYEAFKYVRVHLAKAHEPVFHHLIGLDKKLTGLTDHQRSLMKLFYEGRSDAEVQQTLEIGSASTIRNHRFALKEKERQAKIFLALMDLLKDTDRHAPAMINPPKTAKMIDDRYHVTEQENDAVLRKYFAGGTDGEITKFTMQEKHKWIVLRQIAKRFEAGRDYTEKEVNEVLKGAYADYVKVRRYLIEYGFMDRESDGSRYWLKV
ncbi:transcriptional regulator [Paenibacillus swuensis]|uniref:Transcriptional regulator n=1 Tax=Paenibacillus swuensis TaxID=1178515 RepID=A0A172TG40_9BACL|nr:DUF2087 domain-containing protein [Paenibacillus swuensis]ANE45753.1 transcriptional regulator [Paenibacillus swuensis]